MKKQATNELPFIHLFETISGYYLYDVNRNKFIQIPKDVYRFLEHQQKLSEQNPAPAATETYVNHLMKRGFLKNRHVEKVKHPYTDVAKYFLKHILCIWYCRSPKAVICAVNIVFILATTGTEHIPTSR